MKCKHFCNIFVILLVATLGACKPDSTCRLATDVRMQVPITVHGSLDTLIVQGVGNDSVLYNANASIQAILLPLRQDKNRTQFSLFFNDKYDTLTIFHTNNMQFISLACGCVVNHIIDSVHATVRIDSVEIVNSAVERTLQDNIKIYLKP